MYIKSFTLVTSHNKSEFMHFRFGTHLKIILDANYVHENTPNRFCLYKESKWDLFRDTELPNIRYSYEHCSPETSKMNQFVFGISSCFRFSLESICNSNVHNYLANEHLVIELHKLYKVFIHLDNRMNNNKIVQNG